MSEYPVNNPNGTLNLDHQFTTKNSINVAEVLTKIQVNGNSRILTYYTNDLYVIIQNKDILRITKSLLLKHNDARTTKQLIKLLDVILQQNYFYFKKHKYLPETEVSLGSLISSTIAEIFLQHMEKHLGNGFLIQRTAFYTTYLYDMLLIYNSQSITPGTIHKYINQVTQISTSIPHTKKIAVYISWNN